MDEIRQVKIPSVLPELQVTEHEVQERPFENWEYRSGNIRFNFLQGKILIDGQDFSRFISAKLTHLPVSYWTQIARRLASYRQWALKHAVDPEQMALFAALVHAFLTKISGRLKKKFDETMDGMSFQLEEGELLLNGINVHAFVQMTRRHPTPRAKIFLKGLKSRLLLMLSNRFGNPNYEKIREVVEALVQQIDEELLKPSNEVICLPEKT